MEVVFNMSYCHKNTKINKINNNRSCSSQWRTMIKSDAVSGLNPWPSVVPSLLPLRRLTQYHETVPYFFQLGKKWKGWSQQMFEQHGVIVLKAQAVTLLMFYPFIYCNPVNSKNVYYKIPSFLSWGQFTLKLSGLWKSEISRIFDSRHA